MDEIQKANYCRYSQEIKFQHCDNVFKAADIKLKVACHNYQAANILCDNTTTLHMLKNDLKEYSDLVSDQSGVNNYATGVSVLHSNSRKLRCEEWKSSLEESFGDPFEFVQKLPCVNQTGVSSCSTIPNFNKDFETFVSCINKPVTSNPKPLEVSNSFLEGNKQLNITSKNLALNSNENHTPAPLFQNKRKEQEEESKVKNAFRTARDELNIQNMRKYGNSGNNNSNNNAAMQSAQPKRLGTRRGVQNKFISPLISNTENERNDCARSTSSDDWSMEGNVDERLKNIDPGMVELIRSEIMDNKTTISWDDIAGLEFAKTSIKEAVVWPMLRPDIFTGLRRPPKGILLFGPPGTGKTLIAKCVASQSKSTFFSISASSLMSKWIGEGEKMVRALFTVARCHQPAVIFIDEVDCLLSQRSETEHESSRRLKSEFLVQLDGASTEDEERILLVGATNRPQELDEAARRRFVKRLYIPLPELQARYQLVERLMSKERHNLIPEHITQIATLSHGYSGADMRNLCSEAALGPIRCIDINMIANIDASQVRPVTMDDFQMALSRVKASVSSADLNTYIVWDQTYGSGHAKT